MFHQLITLVRVWWLGWVMKDWALPDARVTSPCGKARGNDKRDQLLWPRPGSDQPFEKRVFYTKVSDQICAVGYYEE